ncbi:MAG: hypothetical protein NC433_01885 [Clostridiales bacterium]|nr:hypothetical protein [Clostridiales bacterium]
MRDKHLTAEEIIKYMDATDMSEDYLLWLEEATEHIQICDVCQNRLHRAMTVDSLCEEEGLSAGLKLMEHEEEIRRNILIAHLSRMQEQERIAKQERITELLKNIRNGYVERFVFSAAALKRSAGAVRGADSQHGQQVTLEKSEDKLLLKIPGRQGREKRSGNEKQSGNENCPERENCSGTVGICDRLTVILQMEDEEPIIKEAFWDETCGQYVAVVDGFIRGDKLEVYLCLE